MEQKRSKEDLKRKSEGAANEIIEVLKKYNFTTAQASIVLTTVSQAIREAQGERIARGEK